MNEYIGIQIETDSNWTFDSIVESLNKYLDNVEYGEELRIASPNIRLVDDGFELTIHISDASDVYETLGEIADTLIRHYRVESKIGYVYFKKEYWDNNRFPFHWSIIKVNNYFDTMTYQEFYHKYRLIRTANLAWVYKVE